MARFGFLTWYGAGNQGPSIGLAQELRARGHEVCFAGYASQRGRFESLGFDFRLLRRADASLPAAPPDDWMPVLVAAVWASPEQRVDVAELLAEEAWDAVVVDCLMFSALSAAEDAMTPTAVLVHSAPSAMATPGGPLDQLTLPALNRVRADAGQQPVPDLWSAWARFPTLCASLVELDQAAGATPSTFEYVGPLFEATPPSGWSAPWAPDDSRPLVVASFSTGVAWDQTSRIRRTLDALAGEPYRVLVTGGAYDGGPGEVPANAIVVAHIPHAEVLPAAAAVVTHAGHGTVCAALAHGRPLVCLPNPAADQPALSAQMAALGAGIALDGETATPAEIASAVDAVVGIQSYADAALGLAAAVRRSPGAAGAADRVERLAVPAVG